MLQNRIKENIKKDLVYFVACRNRPLSDFECPILARIIKNASKLQSPFEMPSKYILQNNVMSQCLDETKDRLKKVGFFFFFFIK